MSYKFTLLNSLQFLVYFLAIQSRYAHLYLYLGAGLPTLHPRCKWFLFFFICSSKTFAGEGLEKWFLNETESQEYQVLFLVHLMTDCEIFCQSSHFLVSLLAAESSQGANTFAQRQSEILQK